MVVSRRSGRLELGLHDLDRLHVHHTLAPDVTRALAWPTEVPVPGVGKRVKPSLANLVP